MDYVTLVLPIAKSIAFAILVLIIGMFMIKWITTRTEKLVSKKNIDATLKPFIMSVTNVGLKIILAVIVISILGIDTTSFVAIFASAGLAIGLAFQGSLSNFAGGVLLLITRPIKVGDYIEANGYGGTVEAIQILYTQLTTVDNKVVHIPNGSLSNTSIINYSAKDTRRVDFQFSASYDADCEKVINTLSDIVNNHPQIMKSPETFVRMSEHGDNAVIYTVRVWVKAADYWTVHFDVIESVKKRFDAEHISIPYPQMDVRINQ